MRRIGILLFVLLGLAFKDPCHAEGEKSLSALFAQGNAISQKGAFQSAERNYRSLIEAGVDDAAVYYNLGNSCFKQKRLGEAIYYWEKARRKSPGDSDIRENLELANLLLVDRIEAPQDPLPLRFLNRTVHLLSISQESWFALAFFMMANFLFALYILAKSARLALASLIGSLLAGLLGLILACSLSWKIYEGSYRREAVIVEEKIELRSGPGMENITVFTVHEGVIVRVRAGVEGWYQVSLPNGWSGWLPQNAIRIL
jgi:tetratricopeptide (TPR) repeat protein